MAQKIKTNIKFFHQQQSSNMCGFVTKVNGSWRGCREDCDKKKIVLIDPKISSEIQPNTLYSCTLIPMKNDGGFIAISANIIQFEATVSTSISDGNKYQVKIQFGNKSFVYDAASKNPKLNNIQKIANLIRNRMDMINPQQIAEDFLDSACLVKRMYVNLRPSI